MIPQTANGVKCDADGTTITIGTFNQNLTCGEFDSENSKTLPFGKCVQVDDGFYAKAAKSGAGFGAGKKAAQNWGDGSGAVAAVETEYDSDPENTAEEGIADEPYTAEDADVGSALTLAVGTALIAATSIIV